MAEKDLSTFELNPVMALGIIGSALALAVSFGATISEGQIASIMDFAEKFLPAVPLVVAWFARRLVFPAAKVEAAVGASEARRIAGTTTKAASLLLIFVLVASGVGCTGAMRAAIQAEDQVHEGLRRARTTIVKICPETNLSQVCSTTKSAFNDVLDAAATYNRGLRDKTLAGGPALIQSIRSFIEKIKTLQFPDLTPITADLEFAREGVRQ